MEVVISVFIYAVTSILELCVQVTYWTKALSAWRRRSIAVFIFLGFCLDNNTKTFMIQNLTHIINILKN